MLKKILLGLAAALGVLLIVIATRPAEFHIERSTVTSAPPEAPFALVNDFQKWALWSPFERLDPSMKKSFEGAPAGVGAIYAWSGNDDAGEGRMTIEKVDAPSVIGIKLEFTKPFAATNAATFTFAKVSEGTKITWAMDGKNSFGGKAASLFMDLDKMVGADFEKGLAALKAVSEKGAPSGEAAAK
jgi:hypothetical protein